MTEQIIFNVLVIISILVGFFYVTKHRLSVLEDELKLYKKDNTDILDRLARIETKLDYLK
jgi:predicted RND superfamily exporter protein